MNTKVGRNDPCPCGSGRKFKWCCIDRPSGPAVELVKEHGSDGWKIELKNFRQFQNTLGPDILAQFSRCFVHADRLTSMTSFVYVSQQYYGSDSHAFSRDLHTMVWFTVGTLRELALAIKDLRSALAKRDMLDPNSAPWKKLREVEKRWDADKFYRKMRDKAGFHVDSDVVSKGLAELAGERDVVLSRGEGPKAVRSSLTLGLEALHNGLGIDLASYGQFLEKVRDDHGIASEAIQGAFILAAQSVGIPVGDE